MEQEYKVTLTSSNIIELENAIARARMVLDDQGAQVECRVRTRLGANAKGSTVKEITFYYAKET